MKITLLKNILKTSVFAEIAQVSKFRLNFSFNLSFSIIMNWPRLAVSPLFSKQVLYRGKQQN